jgi:hypothetical protein
MTMMMLKMKKMKMEMKMKITVTLQQLSASMNGNYIEKRDTRRVESTRKPGTPNLKMQKGR